MSVTVFSSPISVSSPCIGVCRMRDDGLCAGCLRSMAEIVRWRDMTEAERLALMAALPERKAAP